MKANAMINLLTLTLTFFLVAEISAQTRGDRRGYTRSAPDSDKDGVPDWRDRCDASDLRPQVHIGGTATSIANRYDFAFRSSGNARRGIRGRISQGQVRQSRYPLSELVNPSGCSLADEVHLLEGRALGIWRRNTSQPYANIVSRLIHRRSIRGISGERLDQIREAIIAALPQPDSDGDGVPNNQDLCPNSDLSDYVTVSVDSPEPYFSDIPNVITTSDGDEELVTPDGCSLTDLIQNGFDAIVAEGLDDEDQSEAVRVFIFDLVDEGYFTRDQGLDLFLAVGGISY